MAVTASATWSAVTGPERGANQLDFSDSLRRPRPARCALSLTTSQRRRWAPRSLERSRTARLPRADRRRGVGDRAARRRWGVRSRRRSRDDTDIRCPGSTSTSRPASASTSRPRSAPSRLERLTRRCVKRSGRVEVAAGDARGRGGAGAAPTATPTSTSATKPPRPGRQLISWRTTRAVPRMPGEDRRRQREASARRPPRQPHPSSTEASAVLMTGLAGLRSGR